MGPCRSAGEQGAIKRAGVPYPAGAIPKRRPCAPGHTRYGQPRRGAVTWDRPSPFVVWQASQKGGWLTDDKKRSSVPPGLPAVYFRGSNRGRIVEARITSLGSSITVLDRK